ncbi:MAG: glycoside hydrolase family 3 N-terminal domain-containing protein [Oscillospiraceae bacterium]
MNNDKLRELVAKMSVREKLAQLTQLTPICFGNDAFTQLTGPDAGLRVDKDDQPHVGSVLNCIGAEKVRVIQREHLNRNKYNIPLIFMADIIHGFKTIFPIPLAVGCSFSPQLAQKAARIAAVESAVSGVHVTFSPMADLVRDARWGRVLESYGEDPMINARFAEQNVIGYQGESIHNENSIAACVKHFAGYGAPEGGREYSNAEISEGTLEQMYLPSYKAAVDAGAKLVMISFNTINRVPMTANASLVKSKLRNDWKFDGCVISDYNAVGELMAHGIAKNGAEAAERAINGGMEIEMMSTHFLANGEELVNNKKISLQQLDDATLNVLKLKNDLGLFENPYRGISEEKEKELHLCQKHIKVARDIAIKCPVLLQNNNQALPIGENEKIGLVGPFAKSRHVLGAWSAGNTEGVSLMEGLASQIGADKLCVASTEELGSLLEGCQDIAMPNITLLKRKLAGCKRVIVAVGENQNDTGEGASKTDLHLTQNQMKLVSEVKALGKVVIAVVFSARPLVLQPILENCDAVLQAWFLGSESGNALADLLLGNISPSGKLCMSFPQCEGQIPVYYNHMRTGRPQQAGNATRYASRYIDCPNEPLFPFGYGLTYSECSLQNLKLEFDKQLRLSVEITNIGSRKCTETVQVYIMHHTASIALPAKELKDFAQAELNPGQTQTVSFNITQQMLTYILNGKNVFETGKFSFMVGTNSENCLHAETNISQEQYECMERSQYDINT